MEIETLFGLLHRTSSAKSQQALQALAKALVQVLSTETTAADRLVVARALDALAMDVDTAALLPLLDDPQPEVRRHIVRVIGREADDEAIQALVRLLGDNDNAVRETVLEVLLQSGIQSQRAMPGLLALLQDENPTIRMNATQALGQIGDADAVPALLPGLQDPDSRVMLAAAQALGGLGDPRAAQALFAIAADEAAYYRLRGAAVEALVAVNPPHLAHQLMRLLHYPDLSLRRQLIQAIEDVPTESDVETLLDAADWHSSLVRPVRDALVRAGGAAVEAVMVQSLGHVRQWVRALAAEVLGELRSVSAANALQRSLDDTAQEVRVLAAHALGQIGSPAAVDALQAHLSDPQWVVQAAIVSALEQIDTPEAAQAAADWHQQQRSFTATTLDLKTDQPPPDIDLSDLLGDDHEASD